MSDVAVEELARLRAEEGDHIAAFMRVEGVRRRHQMKSLLMPVKPLRPLALLPGGLSARDWSR